jgi:hypothetical protein
VIAAFGVRWVIVDDGDNWESAYVAFSATLLVAAVLTFVVVARVSASSPRRRLRLAGLVICGVGVAASIVAWAYPLWMTVLGVGLATVASAAARRFQRTLLVLAAGQLIGLAVMIAGIEAELGRRDEWGDYPAASALGLATTAGTMIAGLVILRRRLALAAPTVATP